MNQAFPDRSERLFGREVTLRLLRDRAVRPGLTIVVGRPLAGKSWVLVELARRLHVDEGCLVGFHEWKGGESSHIKYAVSDLYTRWLEDSTMLEQARVAWNQQRPTLIPKIGRLVGGLFEKLSGKALSETGVPTLVREAFDGLAEAQTRLLTGDISLSPLIYEEALSLTSLVAEISKRPLILILDAWEKSSSVAADWHMLEAFLKHLDEWPNLHIILAIRHPDDQAEENGAKAFERASALARVNNLVETYELPRLELDVSAQRERLCSFVRSSLRAGPEIGDEQLLGLIDGFPGVLDFWLHAAHKAPKLSVERLAALADDANRVRYSEIPRLLEALKAKSERLVATLALLPRLDATSWAAVRPIFSAIAGPGADSERLLDRLTDRGLLDGNESAFPNFGHDTRHAAVRRWFVGNRKKTLSTLASGLIVQLASNVPPDFGDDSRLVEVLAGCQDSALSLRLPPPVQCLIDAALAKIGTPQRPFIEPAFVDACLEAVNANPSVSPMIRMALRVRGVAHAKRGRLAEARRDLALCLQLPLSTPTLRAKGLIDLSLVDSMSGNHRAAIEGYTRVIDARDSPVEQRTSALYGRGNLYAGLGDEDRAFADYSAVIATEGADPDDLAQSLCNRGLILAARDEHAGAILDYTAACDIPNAPALPVCKCLQNRAVAKFALGDFESALADWDLSIRLPGAPAEEIARSFVQRAFFRAAKGDESGAIEDSRAGLRTRGARSAEISVAHNNLGDIFASRHDAANAIASYTAAIDVPDQSSDMVDVLVRYRNKSHELTNLEPQAIMRPGAVRSVYLIAQQVRGLLGRAKVREEQGDLIGAIDDLSAAIEMRNVPLLSFQEGLCQRALIKKAAGDHKAALVDLTRAIEAGKQSERTTRSLYLRAQLKRDIGDARGAIADYDRGIEMAATQTAVVGGMLYERAYQKSALGDDESAILDYTRVIDSPHALSKTVAMSLNNRGVILQRMGDRSGAIADYTAAIDLPDASPDPFARARLNRAQMRVEDGDLEGAVADLTEVISHPEALPAQKAGALLRRGSLSETLGDLNRAEDDYREVSTVADAPQEIIEDAAQHLAGLHKRNSPDPTGVGPVADAV